MTYTTGDILLNKYRIERMLGHGGFAEVYLATHLQLSAPRALKVLRKDAPGLGSSDYRFFEERFQLEAQLGAMFDDPHIVRVYDFERDEETLILAMEYCPGSSLADRLRQAKSQKERLPLEQVLQTALEVSRGLAELHQQDIVHRDLKPSNILFDARGRAKVSDLGLAQTPGGFSQRSLLGSLAPHHPGTPGYMSPEQEKQTDYLRPASDVYALGVVLFEALTGRNYHNLAPGTRLSSLRTDVPGWLDELLTQILLDDPRSRPWDGKVLLGLVEQGVQDEARQQKAAQEHQAAEEKARREVQEQQRKIAESRQQKAAQEHQAAEEKARREAADKARLEAEAQQHKLAKEKRQKELAEQQRLALEEKAQSEAAKKAWRENEEKVRLEAETQRQREAKERAEKEAETQRLKEVQEKAKKEAEAQRLKENQERRRREEYQRQVSGFRKQNDQPWAEERSQPPASEQKKNRRFPFVWIGLALAGLVILGWVVTHLPRQTWTSPVDGMEMVYIPAGDFKMGCDPAHNGGYDCYKDELPLHKVYLDAYWIDKTEVTNAQYEQCVAAGVCDPPGSILSASQSYYFGNTSFDSYPVVYVSWQNASKYCAWAGRELPTEAQWEKAARGEGVRTFPWGDASPTCDLVNGEVNGKMCVGNATEVGSYPSGDSPYGVLDMAGNVWEWVSDWYDKDYYNSQEFFENPLGPSTGIYRVFRGGSFLSRGYYGLRSAYRSYGLPGNLDYSGNRSASLGFRCAAPPAP